MFYCSKARRVLVGLRGLTALCVLGALSALPAAAQNIVANGDFSTNGPGAGVIPTSWGYTPAVSSDWGILNDGNSFPGGGNYFWLNSGPGVIPTLSQVLTVTPGTTYNVSGVYRTQVIGGTPNSFEVRFLDSGTNGVLASNTFNPTGPTTWTPFAFASSFGIASVRLEIRSQVGGDSDYVVDNVSVVAQAASSAAPEPGSLALLLSVAGMAGGIVRRRRAA